MRDRYHTYNLAPSRNILTVRKSHITNRNVSSRAKLSEAASRRLMHTGARIPSFVDRPSQRLPRAATLVAHSPLRTLPPRWPAHAKRLSTPVARASCARSVRTSEGARRVVRARTALAHAQQPLLANAARPMAICAAGTWPQRASAFNIRAQKMPSRPRTRLSARWRWPDRSCQRQLRLWAYLRRCRAKCG